MGAAQPCGDLVREVVGELPPADDHGAQLGERNLGDCCRRRTALTVRGSG